MLPPTKVGTIKSRIRNDLDDDRAPFDHRLEHQQFQEIIPDRVSQIDRKSLKNRVVTHLYCEGGGRERPYPVALQDGAAYARSSIDVIESRAN